MKLRRGAPIRSLLALSLLAALGSGWAFWLGNAPPAEAGPVASPETEAEVDRLRETLMLLAWIAQNPELPRDGGFGREVAAEARRQLAAPDHRFRDDCSGFVSAVFTELGVPMDGVVVTLWDHAVEHDALHWEDVPRIGDLAFFEETYDRNRNGRWDDGLTHIGIVLDVEPDGTAVIGHAGVKSGRGLTRLNLARPETHRDEGGRILNSYLREPAAGDPARARYLTGELWVAFATVDPSLPWLEWLQPP